MPKYSIILNGKNMKVDFRTLNLLMFRALAEEIGEKEAFTVHRYIQSLGVKI